MSDGDNGNGHARAARNALRLDESTLSLVAAERGMTLPQLLVRLTGLLLEAAEGGDVNATKDLRSYASAAWIARGSTGSQAIFRRIKTGMRRGLLSLDEGVRALKFVSVARELETSDLDRRLRAVEQVAGTALRIRAEEEEAS